MRTLMLTVMATLCSAENIQIAASDALAQKAEKIRAIGGVDITPLLEIEGENHEWPSHGVYWSVERLRVVVEIGEDTLSVCPNNDFSESKQRRELGTKQIKRITINSEAGTFDVE
jgi:hypothetical protein